MIQSPLHQRFEASDALMIPYGEGDRAVAVVGAFEEVGIEYAAIRKGCVLFDMPHAGTVVATGSERLPFLNNMVTQKVIDLEAGRSVWSFWLNRKGRIDADLRITERGDRTLISVDHHLAGQTANTLTNFVFAEDAEMVDRSDEFHRMALHGVGALAVLSAAAGDESLATLEPGRNAECQIAGVHVVADRDDLTGDPGVVLCLPRDGAAAVYDALLEVRENAPSVKPAGWFAVNSARIEAGRPVFNLDFGHDSLPAETGVIADRVDFRKGCYLGQEVVARMDARKARKRAVCALRITPDESGASALPAMGEPVFTPASEGEPIGAITSSTISPMLSGACVALATLRDKESAPGTELIVSAEGKRAKAVVQDGLTFWARK